MHVNHKRSARMILADLCDLLYVYQTNGELSVAPI